MRKQKNTVTDLLLQRKAGFRRLMSCVLPLKVFLSSNVIFFLQFYKAAQLVWRCDLKGPSTFSLRTFLFGISKQDAGSVCEYLLKITTVPQEFTQISYLRPSEEADHSTHREPLYKLVSDWILICSYLVHISETQTYRQQHQKKLCVHH